MGDLSQLSAMTHLNAYLSQHLVSQHLDGAFGGARCTTRTPGPYTYKTKLKLDKEVGGGNLSDLRTNVVSCKSIQFPKFKVQA